MDSERNEFDFLMVYTLGLWNNMLTLLTNLFGFLQTEDIAHPLGLRVALEKQAKSNSFYVTQVKSLVFQFFLGQWSYA